MLWLALRHGSVIIRRLRGTVVATDVSHKHVYAGSSPAPAIIIGEKCQLLTH